MYFTKEKKRQFRVYTDRSMSFFFSAHIVLITIFEYSILLKNHYNHKKYEKVRPGVIGKIILRMASLAHALAYGRSGYRLAHKYKFI